MKSNGYGIIAAIVAAWFAAAAPAAAQERPTNGHARLTVEGEGRVAAVPDMATISLGVVAEAGTAGQAVADLTAALDPVMADLEAQGIAAADMQTRNLSLRPVYSNDGRGPGDTERPRILGFEATSDLVVRVRDLDRLGALLDAVVREGANRFGGLTFGLSEPGPAADRALTAAMEDAMRKAGLLAAAAGVELGPVVRIDEIGGGVAQPVMMRMAEASDAVPVAAGEVTTEARVSATFELRE